MAKIRLTKNQKNTLKKYSSDYKVNWNRETFDYCYADRLIAALKMAFDIDVDDANAIQLLDAGKWSIYLSDGERIQYVEGDGDRIVGYSLSGKYDFDEMV